ncbi:hypothetical protein P4O66_006812 [Electrophorus voltai]|uniref:ERO1-like protein beta n=1 Tax=Electrophorus voltai TaxID=2609070 RepID=A0AAD9DZB2_9TELE|nr:hypothetical protein P4O66_006812 [Electrophorus voltai]
MHRDCSNQLDISSPREISVGKDHQINDQINRSRSHELFMDAASTGRTWVPSPAVTELALAMVKHTILISGFLVLLCLLLGDFVCGWFHRSAPGEALDHADQSCFCHLTGVLDDCFCDIESIDVFNNLKIFPLIRKLIEKDFFRYYRVNLKRPCPFWPDDSHCSIRDCHVEPCPESKIPVGIKSGNYNKCGISTWPSSREHPLFAQQCVSAECHDICLRDSGQGQAACSASSDPHVLSWQYSLAANAIRDIKECEQAHELGAINSTLSNQSKEAFEDWAHHDDAQDHFCGLDDETSPEAEYVDLRLNPERYTGYKGPSAWRVWNSIYEENCFKPRSVYRPLNPLAPSRGDDDGEGFYDWLEGLCLEKRVFYRLISGLHSSINIHLCAEHLLDEAWGKAVWGANVHEFRRRFGSAETKGEGTRRLKNLYFLYLIELRALSKVAPYFERAFVNLYTGNVHEDSATKELLLQILTETKAFPMHFDESSMFAGHKMEARRLKTQGLGTALRILFSEKEIKNLPENSPSKGFQLTRQEIVALLNAFGRLSTSIKELHNFRTLLKDQRDYRIAIRPTESPSAELAISLCSALLSE